jgi:replicative DNA helicase
MNQLDHPNAPGNLKIVPDDTVGLPASEVAEAEVLSAMFMNADIVPTIVDMLSPGDFWTGQHSIVMDAIIHGYRCTGVADTVTVHQSLIDRHHMSRDQACNVLSRLLDRGGMVSHVEHYVEIIRKKAVHRNLILAARDIEADLLKAQDITADKATDIATKAIAGAAGTTGQSMDHLAVGLYEQLAHVEKCQNMKPGEVVGLRTGVSMLDSVTSGLDRGWLVVILGKPGMGKTALATGIAYTAGTNGHGVAFFSAEMPRRQMAGRFIAAHAHVPPNVQKGRMNDNDKAAVYAARPALESMPIYMDDFRTTPKTMSAIATRCRGLARKCELRLVVIDYLQLMVGADRRHNTTEQLDNITRASKSLAMELNCVVLMLAQPTLEDRRNKQHLDGGSGKGSGGIEADADLMLSPYRPDPKGRTKEARQQAGIDVLKFRDGEPRDVKVGMCRFNGARCCFEDMPAGYVGM